MRKNPYKEYQKRKKLEDKYEEEIVFNDDSTIIKILFLLFEILSKIFEILFYIGIIILCSIGATVIANKIGIINIF